MRHSSATGISGVRPLLDCDGFAGALAFLEVTGVGNMDAARLGAWFEENAAALGHVNVSVVAEPDAGAVRLHPAPSNAAMAAQLGRVVATARRRVLDALRAFVMPPSDDRFVRAAIFRGDVKREDGRWIARPRENAPLSAIVLSLLAASILSNRELFEAELCVCDSCGRVSFSSSPAMRHACSLHVERSTRATQRIDVSDIGARKTIARAG